MSKRTLPLSKAYRLFEPGPTVLLTTTYGKHTNVMTMSWQTPMDFDPPLLGCIISDRNFTFELLKKSGECVINIPTVEILDKVISCGNTTGRRINKFETFDLTPKPAKFVQAPLIDECFANFECVIFDASLVNKYCLFILEIVQAWRNPKVKEPKTLHHEGQGLFMTAGKRIQTKSKMK
jgi:flavin reductase (DIM6/NTAB) family NADH-FMN oxidoreductase RutF